MIMCLNARSLCIEKFDELLAVVRTNDVGCVCVTETWFKPYMSTEYVSLAGFCCERKDRLEKGGGGVACYVAETITYERLHDLEEDGREIIWLIHDKQYGHNSAWRPRL